MSVQTIHLHGFLGKKYGKTVKLDCANMFQVMSGLISRFGPQFKEDIRANNWHVINGKPEYEQGELQGRGSLGEEDLSKTLTKKTLHIVPEVVGASAALRTIIGIVLIVVGVYFQQPWLVQMGAALALGGVVEMLMKPPTQKPEQPQDERASKIFNGAQNVTTQGGPVPLLVGRVRRASSVVISTDFSSDETY